jgi:hypothetical protein
MGIVCGMHHGNLHLADANLLESQRRNPAARLDRIRRPSSLFTLTLLARCRPHQSLPARRCANDFTRPGGSQITHYTTKTNPKKRVFPPLPAWASGLRHHRLARTRRKGREEQGEMGGEEDGRDKSIVVMLQRLQAAKGQVRKLEEALRQKGVDVGDDVGGREGSPPVNEEAVRRQLQQFAQVAKAEAKGRRKSGEDEGDTVGSFEESFWDPKEVMRDLG